jgi:hypothetical protein
MPFTQQTSKEFTREIVLALDPEKNGVYGLFRRGVWVYIGQGNIRERLLAHLGGDNPCIVSQKPTHWVKEFLEGNASMAREKELILEFNPICNRQVG